MINQIIVNFLKTEGHLQKLEVKCLHFKASLFTLYVYYIYIYIYIYAYISRQPCMDPQQKQYIKTAYIKTVGTSPSLGVNLSNYFARIHN